MALPQHLIMSSRHLHCIMIVVYTTMAHSYLISLSDQQQPATATAVLTAAPATHYKRDNTLLPASVCGMWLDPSASLNTIWSHFCAPGTRCAIDTFVTPPAVFCPFSELPPYTAYFPYGEWPSEGCGTLQACCDKDNPQVELFKFDNGNSTLANCVPATQPNYTPTRYVSTLIDDLSIQLSTYTPPSIIPLPTSTAQGDASSPRPPRPKHALSATTISTIVLGITGGASAIAAVYTVFIRGRR
ncbi:hypothetical protein EV356DRAFT_312645 [Viridothelium virens]|uniref:Uncharacterized protein n=1 Tax=Viridothelium virens TaxID=1048519 RepID=A0A6A6GZW5_VIRVR|nr:hypothetical protein EV356DRAFT_312645 [Viridothelium virens]